MNYLKTLLEARRAGKPFAFYSCCSGNEDVIAAAMERAIQTDSPLLVEATANQVNQFGGYTGMDPAMFKDFVYRIAGKVGLARTRIILGGDHLGPLVWCDEPEEIAMAKAENLVRAFVRAGYHKIHLDTSMRLGTDSLHEAFPVEICARRGARLCAACEDEYELNVADGNSEPPIYVIGSEVPVPGGEMSNNPSDEVTSPEGCDKTIEAYRREFFANGLGDAFSRVAALVVEMGVEFSEYTISEYDREKFAPMARHVQMLPMSYEAHSTDYQTVRSLTQMREDGAMFLKVGPALTFALRDALFKFEQIEKEIISPEHWSNYRETLDAAMLAAPAKWQPYYRGSERDQAFARAFSFSDRCRYYFDVPEVKRAHNVLVENLSGKPLPLCLLISYFFNQYRKIREGLLANNCTAILYDSIGEVIDDYLAATNNNRIQ